MAQRILKIEGNIWYEGGLRNLSKQLFPAPKFCPSWYSNAPIILPCPNSNSNLQYLILQLNLENSKGWHPTRPREIHGWAFLRGGRGVSCCPGWQDRLQTNYRVTDTSNESNEKHHCGPHNHVYASTSISVNEAALQGQHFGDMGPHYGTENRPTNITDIGNAQQ